MLGILINLCMLLLFRFTTCQKEITGAGKATQSSDYGHCIGDWCHYHTPDVALTGESEHEWVDTYTYTCSSTAPDKKEAWWKVSFPSIQFITHLEIYYRGNTAYRLAGFSVYITNKTTVTSPPTGHLCYRHKGPDLPNVYQNIDCHYLGKNVVIYNNRTEGVSQYEHISEFAYVELCRVRIYGCRKGFSGNNCIETCPLNCLGNHCFPKNRTCVWGCNWRNCNKEICDKYDGTCTLGCIPGVTGDFCPEIEIATSKQTTTTTPHTASSSSLASINLDSDSNDEIIPIMIAAPIALLIVVIATIVYFWRRKTCQRRQNTFQENTPDPFRSESIGNHATNEFLPPDEMISQNPDREAEYVNQTEISNDEDTYMDMTPQTRPVIPPRLPPRLPTTDNAYVNNYKARKKT